MTTDWDLAAAYEAFRPWRERPVRSRIGTEELAELEQSVADAIAAARREGRSAALQRRSGLETALAELLGQDVHVVLVGGSEWDGSVYDVRDGALILETTLGQLVVPFHAILLVLP